MHTNIKPLVTTEPVRSALLDAINKLDLDLLIPVIGTIAPDLKQPIPWFEVITQYRQFLYLKGVYPNKLLVPTHKAEAIWRAHILDTRTYRQDCERLFNRFIDHYPYPWNTATEIRHAWRSAVTESCLLYQLHFGSDHCLKQFQSPVPISTSIKGKEAA